ncbi:MAG: LpxL/LpxP family Kdo(2)-lipid IV(A) lauroyl/palmitoleoyl acyltransferase [Steroidobacteraceae bacterium]
MPGSSLALLSPRYWPTWLGLALLRALAPLPYRVQLAIGRVLGAIFRRVPIGSVRIVRRNLELCMPELGARERETLVARHFESLGIGVVETALAWWASDERILELARIEGLEHLEAALARGRGAILLSAHFTTLEIGARAITATRPVNIMYRPSKDALLTEFLSRNRARRSRRAIPRDDVRTLIAALKANEPVWYAPDQSYRKKGAEMVRLFGIPAATNTATSRLARLTGAAVLPYFPERLPDARGYRILILPALEDFPSDSPVADAEHFNRLIEAQVRRVPEQYLWIHRRFKGLTPDYPDYYARSARRLKAEG